MHTDLCGPTRTRGLNGEIYFMLLIDDYYRMTWVTFLREKSQALEKFNIFKSIIENQVDVEIKCLRSDKGEFTSSGFDSLCEDYGIRIHFFL